MLFRNWLKSLINASRPRRGTGETRRTVKFCSELLEDRTVLAANFATGAAFGEAAIVRVFEGATQVATLNPYGAAFLGGVQVAMADVTGDRVADVITAAGPGGSGHVKVFDGVSFAEVRSFLAFPGPGGGFNPGFNGAVNVAGGDIDNDGQADIVTSVASDGPSHVKAFSGRTGALVASFFAYDGFGGGAEVAAADVNGDNRAEIVTVAGPGGNGHVKAFQINPDGSTTLVRSFLAYTGFNGQVNVAAGHTNSDNRAEIVTGAAVAGGHVKVFDGATGAETRSFFAFPGFGAGQVEVGVTTDRNGNGNPGDILVGAVGTSHIKVFDGLSGAEVSSFLIGATVIGSGTTQLVPPAAVSPPPPPPNTAPVITSSGSASVAENQTAVTTVTATDADGNPVTFSITGGADAARFAINPTTGVLTFVVAPDFEVPTDAGANNVYDVVVRASDGTLTDDQAIAVTVANVGTTPVITSNGGGDTAAVNVPENTTAVTTVVAVTEPATPVTYSIAGGADAARFAINPTTGVLTFVVAPDFEVPTDAGANNVYDVVVRASAGGNNDDQAIAVTVTPVNDAPVITSNGGGAAAATTALENQTAVTTVTATDADGNPVTFSITGGADAARFAINPTTGVLTFVVAPDFEVPTDAGANNVYDVVVRASDGTLTDDQAIAVTVANVGTTPVITSNGGGDTAAVNVPENTTAVTTVVAVTEPATPVTYSIAGGADAARFAINPTTGVLTFVVAPDFEVPTDAGANNVYDVVVRASAGGNNDDQAIAVTVTPVSEFPPVITSNGGGAAAAIDAAENQTAVTTVTATNADNGETLTYALSGPDAARFAISAAGVLTFLVAPDFEAPTDVGGNNVYNVTVTVSDGTQTDAQAIAVTVTPVNEFAPVITSNGGGAAAAVNVPENTTAVTTVTATNADNGETLTYSIFGGADQLLFAINPTTGVLTFVVAPDFEVPTDAGANNVYDVVVRASDGTLTDDQAIAVTVTDVGGA